MMIPNELHEALHQRNLYAHASTDGAQVAFEWIVDHLCKIPLKEAAQQLSDWYAELHPDRIANNQNK